MPLIEQSAAIDSCLDELSTMKALLDMVDEVCFVLDQDFIITYVNRHTINSFEKKADELIGHAFHEIFPYVKSIINLNSIRQNLYSGQNVFTEVQSPLSGRSFQITASNYENGFLFFMKETTVERRYQQLLHEKDARFLAITAAMSEFILIVQPGGRITFASPTAQQITGYLAHELEDEKLFNFIVPGQRKSAKSTFETLLNSPRNDTQYVFTMQHKDGSELELHAVDQSQTDSNIDGMILKYHP